MVARQQLAVFIVSLLLCGTTLARNYPLKIGSTNGHILVDQSNVPFLIHGDCAWGLILSDLVKDAWNFLTVRKCR